MSEDGLLRSKSTGHPIGCNYDGKLILEVIHGV